MDKASSSAAEFLQTLIGKHVQIRVATDARDRDISGILLVDDGDRLLVQIDGSRQALIYTANIVMVMESDLSKKMQAAGMSPMP